MSTKARPETTASANEFLRKAGVDHLPPEHPLRREALVAWGRYFRAQPNPNIAPNDPVRSGPPKGWKGVV